MDKILRYFPDLHGEQVDKLRGLYDSYHLWNARINVISRKDFHNFYLHHVLHSLAIARVIHFKAGTQILDVGTGGGFPGIPLAILFPESQFVLLDSIRKKLRVIEEIANDFKLNNVSTVHARVEKYQDQFDFITSRAVTQFPKFVQWVKKNIKSESFNELKNGILYLKGGDFEQELKAYKNQVSIYPLWEMFQEEFFETKKLIYLPLNQNAGN